MVIVMIIVLGSRLILHILMVLPASLVLDILILDCGSKYADDYTR